MKKVLLLVLFAASQFALAQAPLVKIWDKRFGGGLSEDLKAIQQTRDRGFIMGGTTDSDSSGDVSQHTRGASDYWIVKTDSLGNKEWDKRFGGNWYDLLNSLQQTSDGGYILGGWTHSDSSRDVTQHTRDTSSNFSFQGDYWVVKTDSLGNKQWDKRFGGFVE